MSIAFDNAQHIKSLQCAKVRKMWTPVKPMTSPHFVFQRTFLAVLQQVGPKRITPNNADDPLHHLLFFLRTDVPVPIVVVEDCYLRLEEMKENNRRKERNLSNRNTLNGERQLLTALAEYLELSVMEAS